MCFFVVVPLLSCAHFFRGRMTRELSNAWGISCYFFQEKKGGDIFLFLFFVYVGLVPLMWLVLARLGALLVPCSPVTCNTHPFDCIHYLAVFLPRRGYLIYLIKMKRTDTGCADVLFVDRTV